MCGIRAQAAPARSIPDLWLVVPRRGGDVR